MDKLKNKIQQSIHQLDVDDPSATTWEEIRVQLHGSGEDLLKPHIAENKKELDIDMPDDDAWNAIKRNIAVKTQAPVMPLKTILKYVSAACIITVLGFSIFRYLHIPGTKETNEGIEKSIAKNNRDTVHSLPITTGTNSASNEKEMADLPVPAKESPTIKKADIAVSKQSAQPKKIALPPQFLQMEKDYDDLIEGQLKYTRGLAIYGESSSYFERFKNDLQLLDNQEKELRKAIARNGLQDNSIDELAMIYQQKLIVLKKLQNEINKTSSRNKNVTDSIPVYINL